MYDVEDPACLQCGKRGFQLLNGLCPVCEADLLLARTEIGPGEIFTRLSKDVEIGKAIQLAPLRISFLGETVEIEIPATQNNIASIKRLLSKFLQEETQCK